MIVELGDDFTSERVVAWYVDASIVFQESSFMGDPPFMSEGGL